MSWVAPLLLPMRLAPAAVKETQHIHVHCGSDGSVPTSSHFHRQMSQNQEIPSSPRGSSTNTHSSFNPLLVVSHATSSYLQSSVSQTTNKRCDSNVVVNRLHREWEWRVTKRLCRWSVQKNTSWPALRRAWRSVRRPRFLLRLRYSPLSARPTVWKLCIEIFHFCFFHCQAAHTHIWIYT